MGVFGSSKELQFEVYERQKNHKQAQRRKKNKTLFYREGIGRKLEAKSPPANVGVPSAVAFHWLNCGRLSLAVPLPGEEKNFPPALLRW